MRGSHFAADKPGDCRKENAHGYSAHQHADDAFERTKHPPVRRKDYITVPDRCITACRKIEGRFPRREAEPAIAAGPQYNQYSVQNDYRGCELHDKCGRANRSESVEITGYSASDPKYERREPRTLQPQRQYHQKNRCDGLTKEAHRSKNIFSRRQCALPCRVRSWPAGGTTETSARRSRRAAIRYQRKTRLEPANSKLLSTTTAVFLAWCCCFLPLDRPVCGGPPQPNN